MSDLERTSSPRRLLVVPVLALLVLTLMSVAIQRMSETDGPLAIAASAGDGGTTWYRSDKISLSEDDCWSDCVRDIVVSHDGKMVAIHTGISEWGDDTDQITIWSQDKTKLYTIQPDDLSASSVMALSENGNFLAYGNTNGEVVITNPGQLPLSIATSTFEVCYGSSKTVHEVIFSPRTSLWEHLWNTSSDVLFAICGDGDDRTLSIFTYSRVTNGWILLDVDSEDIERMTFSQSGEIMAFMDNPNSAYAELVAMEYDGQNVYDIELNLAGYPEFPYSNTTSRFDHPFKDIFVNDPRQYFEILLANEEAVFKISSGTKSQATEEEGTVERVCTFSTSYSNGESMSSNIEIESMTFTPDGKQLIRVAEIGYKETVTVFDISSGESECIESQILTWADNDVDHIAFVGHGDDGETWLITASEDSEVISIWSDQWSAISTARTTWHWVSQHGEVFLIGGIISLYVVAAIAQGSSTRSKQKWAQAREALPRIIRELEKIEQASSAETLDVDVLRPYSIALQTMLGELSAIKFPKDMRQDATATYSRAAMVKATVDRKLWMGVHGLAEERLQKARELSNQGARAHEVGEYREAHGRFDEAMEVAQSVSNDPVMSEHKELAELAASIYERSRDNRAEAQRGIISVDLTSRLELAPSRLASLFESVEDRPIDAKRDAREIEAELEEAVELAKTHEFPEIAAAAMPHISEARRLIARADEVSMSGITSVTSVTSSVKAPTSSGTKATRLEETRLSGWERLEKIASGGMATAYMARESAGRTAVWKQAHGKHNPLASANMKITDEAALLQEIRHPRIPEHFDNGVIEGSRGEDVSVLIMEHIEGGDLKNTVEQVRKVGAQISADKAIEYITHVCEPLEALASRSEPIYHRDLKPHNVIIHPQRGPVIIDWGLAKQVATGSDVSVTRGGSGTWTPPERDAGVSGPFTDVYSLGKILYFLLTKDTPPAILAQDKVTSRIDEIAHPTWIAQFIIWACWPQHEKRIQSIHQFRVLMQNQGVWPEGHPVKSSASDSGDFTTWG